MKKLKKFYLAYGSNLNLRQMESRCPDAELIGYTFLQDMRLIFRGSGSGYYLSIERSTGSQVPCGVFIISNTDERRLDAYEGYPRFYRKGCYDNLQLYTMDGQLIMGNLSAIAYMLPRTAPAGFPSKAYVNTCMEGYDNFKFDEKYLTDALVSTWEEMQR